MSEPGDTSRRPKPRSGPRRARGPLWFLLVLLLALLASWIIGRRATDDRGSSGPDPLAPTLLSFDGERQVRHISIAPPPPLAPATATSGATAPDELEDRGERVGSPVFGPLSISGRILDAQGSPATKVEVRLLRAFESSTAPGFPDRAVTEVALTDAEGSYRFRIEGPPETYRVAVRDPRGALHATPALRIDPWRHVAFPDLRLLPAPLRRVWVRLAGGTGPAFRARLRVRLRPPAGRTGLSPVQLREDLLLPSWRLPGTDAPVPANGLVTLQGIGGGDWEMVLVARDHLPRRLVIGEATEFDVGLELADLRDLDLQGSGGAVWLHARDRHDATWLLPASPDGVLALPDAWRTGGHLWRTGDAPLALDTLEAAPGGALVLPTRGRVRVRTGDAATGWRAELRAAGPRAEDIAEVDRLLGAGDLPLDGYDRRLAAGIWNLRTRDGLHRESPPLRLEVQAATTLDVTPLPPGPAMRRLELLIRDEDGDSPVTSADIALSLEGEDPTSALVPDRILARCDENGRLLLRGLPPGPLDLVVGGPRYEARGIRVVVPEARDARLRHEITLRPVRASAEVFVRDVEGRPYADLDAVLIDARGTITRARSDEDGRLLFLDLAERTQALFAARGADRLALDDWNWLSRTSGAPLLRSRRDERTRLDWTLPRARTYRIRFRLNDPRQEGAGPSTDLRLVAAPEGLAPGLRPTYDLGPCRPGLLRVGPLFPGTYRVLGQRGERLAATEITLGPEESSPVPLDLAFPNR